MSGKEQAFIQEAFDTNWVVPLGPNVNGFEKDLEEFCGKDKWVVALENGDTAAVHLAFIHIHRLFAYTQAICAPAYVNEVSESIF